MYTTPHVPYLRFPARGQEIRFRALEHQIEAGVLPAKLTSGCRGALRLRSSGQVIEDMSTSDSNNRKDNNSSDNNDNQSLGQRIMMVKDGALISSSRSYDKPRTPNHRFQNPTPGTVQS